MVFPKLRLHVWMLILLACCAMPGCGGLNSDPQARRAAEWALERGGTIRIFDVPGEISDPGRLPSGGFALEAVNMNELGIDQSPVTDEDIQVLEGLTNIRTLGLYGSSITDTGCETIATLKTLEELELSQSRITDTGLETLAALPNLEKLFIRNVGDEITQDGVANFKRRSDAQVFR